MVGEISKEHDGFEVEDERSPLLPDRHRTTDLFVCDIFDAAPKGDMASMEHPIFSLSTKPDHRVRRYEHGKNFVEIKPSSDGLATVHDRDILIFCISQLIAKMNAGKPVSRTVTLRAYDLLIATNRMTNGQGYDGLKAALERLRGTTISTNIATGGQEQFDVFGLIDRARIVRQTREGRMQEVEIVLSDWVFNAIQAKEVLTLHRDYFRLRKPLERRLYELARKHCGKQEQWSISLEMLQKKCGSNSTAKEFRRLVRAIVANDAAHSHFPEYQLSLSEEDIITVTQRASKVPAAQAAMYFGPTQELVEWVRQVWPGIDPYGLHREWWDWSAEKGVKVKSPTLAFQRWVERKKAAELGERFTPRASQTGRLSRRA